MQQVFKDLTEKLQDLNARVLVILDDVDRLQPDELLRRAGIAKLDRRSIEYLAQQRGI